MDGPRMEPVYGVLRGGGSCFRCGIYIGATAGGTRRDHDGGTIAGVIHPIAATNVAAVLAEGVS